MHYSLLVLLPKPPDNAEHLHTMLDELMAPYWEELEVDEDGYPHNPQGKWDWWQLGGRWLGLLEANDSTGSYHGGPGVFDNESVHPTGCDATSRGNVTNSPSGQIHAVLGEGVWRDGDPDITTRPALDLPDRGAAVRAWYDQADQQWRDWLTRFWPTIPPEQWLAVIDYHR